jgi:predicted house-cleaning noncanonical NTP pyrophosphatase (MazG superfamily)
MPEDRLEINEMYAILMPWDAYQKFFVVDMDREGLWWGWVGLLQSSARKAFHLKQADAEHPQPRLVRNARKEVSEEGAEACERLLYYADVVKLSAKAQDEYLEYLEDQRAKRLPDLVIPIIYAALERPSLPKAA